MGRRHLAAALSLALALSVSCKPGQPPPPPPPAPPPADVVDANTLDRKIVFGYQGWFACPGDGSPVGGWVHWFRDGVPDEAHATIDCWPDVRELDSDELFPTNMTLPDGRPAVVYSAHVRKTVVRHFRWMKENGIDGVLLQRFSSELSDPRFFELRNRVLDNVRAGAEAHGRVFAVMYDISGQVESTLLETLKKDWAFLVDQKNVTGSDRYLRHEGKPLVAIWGLGYADRPGTPAMALELIDWFKNSAPERYRATVLGGVPGDWRTLSGDSKTDPDWARVYRSWDILSPWTVGRYVDENGADDYARRYIQPDMTETAAQGIEYMPVVFPGFSWANLMGGPLNQIPRLAGRFWWRQVYNASASDVRMIFGAMFDEVDEGTAIYKIAPAKSEIPAQGQFLSLDADGRNLPSDWYLRLAGEATRRFGAGIPIPREIPISP